MTTDTAICFLFMLVFMTISTVDAEHPARAVADDIHAIINEELAACGMKNKMGFGVAIIAKNDLGQGTRRNVTFTAGYNYRDLEKKAYADENTMFCAGSITKHMTATLLVHLLDLLQQRGYRYTLQTEVTDIDRNLIFPGSQFIGVTLEDFLSHRTGISDYSGPVFVGAPKNTTRKHLAWLAANAPRLFPSRANFFYNNHVFGAAGYFAEVLAEKLLGRFLSWEKLLDLYFFEPMGIANDVDIAGYNFTSFPRMAYPYLMENGRYRALDPQTLTLIEPVGPAGAACFTPKSMSVWMQFMLDRGRYRSQQLIRKETLEDTWKSRISIMENPPRYPTKNLGNRTFPFEQYKLEITENGGYGLGWSESRYRGRRLVQHSGGFNSFLSLYSMLPDQRISIFTSSAGPYIPVVFAMEERIHYRLFDYFMNLASLDPADSVCLQLPDPVPSSTASPVTNDTESVVVNRTFYVGSYYHPLHGILKIENGYGGSGMDLFVGREGNATIVCTQSAAECSLRFNGILWYVSESQSDYAVPELLKVRFGFASTGFLSNVTLPLYSFLFPPVFERVWDH